MKASKILGSAIAAILVVVALLLIIGTPAGFLVSRIQDRLERETGYRLTVAGSSRLGLWPHPHVTLKDVTLEGPANRESSPRLTVGSFEADMTLASLWSGQPVITDLKINRPVLNVPLLRERQAIASPSASRPSGSSTTTEAKAPGIERVSIADGTVIFSNGRDHVERRIEGVSVTALVGTDRQMTVTGSGRAKGQPLTFTLKAALPNPPLDRQNIPVELSLTAAGILQAALSAKAEVRINGTVVMINGVAGTIGDSAFNGWASVDLATKPLVKLDLDFRRLDIATATTTPAASQQANSSQEATQAATPPWSDDPIDLKGLNYVDTQLRLSAAELNIGSAHFAPAAIEATLEHGLLKCGISNLGAYGGLANGAITIDASAATPAYTFNSELTGVHALPLLSSAAGFDKLDGKLQASIAVRSTGQSQRAIFSNIDGTVIANFQDGAIRGLNVAQMIRSLTSGTLSGWQESREQATDLTQLSASFQVDKGQAKTSDLNLIGPLVKMTGTGTVDLAAKTLAFRVEPKLVMTTEGQGRNSDPVGFGIPVMIDGPWVAPHIYPDVAGILDNPDAAYARLKEMGKGLFGLNGLGGNSSGGNDSSGATGGSLGDTLNNLLQQGLSQGLRQGRGGSPAPKDPSAPAQNDQTPPSDQNGRPMGDLLKQFFGR